MFSLQHITDNLKLLTKRSKCFLVFALSQIRVSREVNEARETVLCKVSIMWCKNKLHEGRVEGNNTQGKKQNKSRGNKMTVEAMV